MTTVSINPSDKNPDDKYALLLERIEGIMEGYMRSSTHMVNELARIRRHHREDKNEVVNEICRQHKENINHFKDISNSADSLIIELQHMRKVMEALVHSYNMEEAEEDKELF